MAVFDNTHSQTVEKEKEKGIRQEVYELYKRQNELENEIQYLKNMISKMGEQHSSDIQKAHNRIDELEEEVKEIRKILNDLQGSVKLVQAGVDSMNEKTDIAIQSQERMIESQDRFISMLWKAFFILLAIITGVETFL